MHTILQTFARHKGKVKHHISCSFVIIGRDFFLIRKGIILIYGKRSEKTFNKKKKEIKNKDPTCIF